MTQTTFLKPLRTENDLKKRVITLVDLETQVLTNSMQCDFVIGIGALGTAVALHHFGADNNKGRTLVISTLEQNIDLLKHHRVCDENSVITDLHKFFCDMKDATSDPNDTHIAGSPEFSS